MSGDTAGGSLETDEPTVITESSSVWFTWTAPDANPVTFNLFHRGASENSLAAFVGTSVSGSDLFQEAATYQDGNFESILVSPTQAGDVFRIRVASASGHEGTFDLEWGDACSPPANDDFANASALTTGLSGSITDQNVNKAGLETDEVGVFGTTTADANSVWYSWTPATGGEVMFRTELESLWDSTLAVYTGSSPAAADLTEIASNDDYPECCASLVSFTADAGTTYMIRVAGYASMGQFDLEWADDFVRPDTTVALATGQNVFDNASPAQFAVTFSEPVTGFDGAEVDLSLSSATVGSASVQADPTNNDGAHYLVDVPFSSSSGGVTIVVPSDVATDGAGNGNNQSGGATVTIDTTAPNVGVSTRVQGSKVTVNVAAIELNGIDGMECQFDGGSFEPCSNGSQVNMAKGQHTVTVHVFDLAGNMGTGSQTFTIKSGKIKP